MNPLLAEFKTPYQTAPFSKIKNKHFKPAFEEAIKIAKKEIDAIINNNEPPTFKNTVAALDYSGELLSRVSSIFFNLSSAETCDEIIKIAQEVSPLLSDFSNDVGLNQKLFQRIQTVFENRKQLKLTAEETTLLEKKYKSFVRNGANLNKKDQKILRAIDKELSKTSLTFGENILVATNNYQLHITNSANLKGLPDGVIEAAALTAKENKKKGWIFTLHAPSYIPFLTYAKNRALRKEIAFALGSKTYQGNQLDNRENVLKIVQLRYQRAKLLGYKNHAHFVLEEQMATSPQKVTHFLNDLLEKSKPIALKENQQLTTFAKKLKGTPPLQSWDAAYYSEKLKQKLFNIDDEQLKPYFKLENVVKGVFTVAKKLYGLNFEEIFDIDKYHPEVITYKVTDENNEFVAIFYADYHPRKGKQNGAWMTSYQDQFIKNGINHRPHIVNVCNFTKPTATKPSLLTFDEVTTLFHEFGHALHGMLANTTFPGLSGTSVYRDFVELPSQLLENWCYEKEALELFAFHYQTGEVIPIELIDKIKASANFMEATKIVRQLSFGIVDMAWHTSNPEKINDVSVFERKVMEKTQIYPYMEGTCFSTAFSHIFDGGYSSGYYSYKWAEVLDADAFEYFKSNGIFNKELGDKFKEHILSKGGSEHPMKLYKRFRGKEPDSTALLKRAGLLNVS
ncbi:MAG: peptidase M3 [Flavobacteriales bacterium CG_4_10_14_0_2_um_filter_32_8]|nr:MAG: peptidase M3 [Flavobacteriales bacterium CG_4_10_14_0_2_um_filter_32_8]